MPKKIIKKTTYLLLITTIISTHSPVKPDWHTVISDNYPALCIAATAAACAIGKISYGLYKEYTWPNKRIIGHCRTTYASIYDDIQTYYNDYKSDAQLSDWDIKESIIHTKIPFPFMAYNDQITLALCKLVHHNTTITHELKRIIQRKKQLINNNSAEAIMLKEEFTQLESKGRCLQKYITMTCTILSALKNKIALFKEYKDDYHNWSCEQQKRHDRMKHNVDILESYKIKFSSMPFAQTLTKIRSKIF
jgi:hypothetical protein